MPKQKTVEVKKVEIMSNRTEDKVGRHGDSYFYS